MLIAGVDVWRGVRAPERDLASIFAERTPPSGGGDVAAPKAEDVAKLPSFRVTCNRTGDDHKFTSMEAAAKFGSAVNDTFHWRVSGDQPARVSHIFR